MFIPKPGKKDLSDPNSYRLISLLSIIGRGLERVVARRLVYALVEYGLVSLQYLGAVLGVGILDLVYALVYDLELARGKRNYIGICLMDVEGGFNNVWYYLFIRSLENLGFVKLFIK